MTNVVPIDNAGDRRVADFVGLSDPELRRRREQPAGADGGFFVAEGANVIRQLLRSSYRVRSVLVSHGGLRALQPDLDSIDAPVYLTSQPVMEAICGFPFHRGALATADRRALPDLAEVAAEAGVLVVVEGVNDTENLGAIFRNAAAFGAGGVVLDPTTADPLYRRSVRVSMGHVLHVPYTRVSRWPESIRDLRDLGFEVLALTPATGAEDIGAIGSRPRQALLLGSEGAGLSPPALAAADRRVRIAMAPGVDSLNIATATAIVLHHLATNRRRGGNS